MPQKTDSKHSVILVGVGGSGVVWSGTLLTRAGVKSYKYVTRLPNFTTSMRGGSCECMVVLSNEKIATPLVSMGDALIVLENSQLKGWEGRVRPGGIIVLESTDLKAEVERKDITVLKIPAIEIAFSIGNPLVAGLVLLGAYVQATDVLLPDLVEKEIEARFGISESGVVVAEKEVAFSHNLEAFHRGLKIGEDFKSVKAS